MENKIQNGQRPVYEPVKVQLQQINPTGVLCSSGQGDSGHGAGLASYNLGAEL